MEAAGGRLAFDRFMELALYATGLGYYVAGARKFGAAGDFVTAPEVSPVFGRCLARQCAQVLAELPDGELLEFGAGSGLLAAHILTELRALESLPRRYLILELSPELRARQKQTLAEHAPELLARVSWLEQLPAAGFRGLVIANEVLDAMPVQRFRLTRGRILEQYVDWQADAFRPLWSDPSAALAGAERVLLARIGERDDFESEINLRANAWLASLAERIEAGLLLLIDYGYPHSEYYHPQRDRGTLMCHYRHRAHGDPLLLPGLQDITAHVDFSALAETAQAQGLQVAGWTTQAAFLIGCGLENLLAGADPGDTRAHLQLMQGVKMLTLPSHMGERFKVLGLSRGLDLPLLGFGVLDLRHRL